MSSIAIIDYGMGNLHSIAKAVEHVAASTRVRISAEPSVIMAADRVVFPGVGGIGHTMQELARTGLGEVALQAAASKPILCICVGMQALFERSEENDGTDCLGLLPGEVRRFPEGLSGADGGKLKIPHMGWNQVHQKPHPLWDGIAQDSRFYFVHSYYAAPAGQDILVATADYGLEFCCALARENLFAVQFHPEKSQRAGLALLRNFSLWDGQS
ncbi:MAG: imidazole glycerol phosphate synthase subunit HisH [Gammaproteobacteria bacterium]|nr:MAG: imidazole glycerol phosphate synthase subunit HisH [Gammaproteobacteria bacterium]